MTLLRCASRFSIGILAAVLAFGASSACAQQAAPGRTIAKLTAVQGTVLVSQGDGLEAGVNEQRLAPGARVVTTARASATIVFDKECSVKLAENQRVVVHDGTDCAALVAQVESLSPAGAIGGTSASSSAVAAVGPGTIALIGLGAGGAAIYETLRGSRPSLSPN